MKTLVGSIVVAGLVAVRLSAASLASSSSSLWQAKLTAAQEVPKQVVKNAAGMGSFSGKIVVADRA